MDGLKIIKASAGSGKTHTLTQEYIARLLPEGEGSGFDKEAYRHILAVTFTNKATDEMKERVVTTLAKMAKEDTPKGRNAKKMLTAILHDYSGFSISTIDRFFQGVMRSFAREIGEMASYRVELDAPAVLDHAVDLMMASLEDPDNRDLFDWLMEYSMSQIESGEKWDITLGLKEMVRLFLREDFKIGKREVGDLFGKRGNIIALRREMDELMERFKKEFTALGERAMGIMSTHGLSPTDFKDSSKSPFTRFEKMASGELPELKTSFLNLPDSLENWSTKKTPAATKSAIEDAYNDGLNEAVKEAIELLGPDSELLKAYNTALLLRDRLFIIGIFSDLYARMHDYLKENNLILLSETADVLGRIIDGNDTPFIYEKTGIRYDNYLLDEFQDTSRLQWEDFKPLIDNSISEGHSNLIVGDIKQSIYRWRGADLTLLGEEVEKDFPEPLSKTEPLDGNWRSSREIVAFNNEFYSAIGELLKGFDAKVAERIEAFYSDCVQTVNNQEAGNGHVKVIFLPEKSLDEDGREINWRQAALGMTGGIVESLKERYSLSDITFLVRTNREGAQVATKLISLGYEVVTEDSLNISASPIVQKMASLLKKELNPEDEINNQVLASLFGGEIPTVASTESPGGAESSLYGLCEAIIRTVCEEVSQSETPFVTAFMDAVLSYTEKFGSDLAGFLEWWDSAGCRKSISAPEGADAIKVMTIHKAKGLKSGAIVLPFLKSSLKPSGQNPPYIWCRPSVEPFSKAGLVPVKATKALEKTIFAEEYAAEMLGVAVDAVNTAYVAMTRAVGDMVIIAPKPEKEDKRESVSALLYAHLKERLDADDIFEAGKPDEDRHSEESHSGDLRMQDYKTVPLGGRLGVALRGGDYYDREAGIVRHDILARIDTVSDIAGAVASAVNSEELAASKRDEMVAEMEGYIASVAARHWFDGTYRPMNEVSIVDGDGEVFRPDRVLVEKGKSVGEGMAIVIDYKFGRERAEHRTQVGKYMELLRNIGYTDVSGYIWYCKFNKVEECG